jgi:hypothetical protein
MASILVAKEGKIVIHHKGQDATLYVDGEKSIKLTKEITPLMLEEGNHTLKVVESISKQCEKYQKKEIYVSSSGSLKVTFKLDDKREPTEIYKKILDKKDSKKLQRFYRIEEMLVTDLKAKLMWQDDAYPSRTKRDLKGAIKYCQSLRFETFDNWRVPTYEELLSIVDYDRYHPAIIPLFKKTFSKRYWSSSQDVSSPDYAWVVDFGEGKTSTTIKSRRHYVRCVREE